MLKSKTFTVADSLPLSDVGRALSSPQRIEILETLGAQSLSITELSRLLKQPMSTMTTNIDILEEVGLISTKTQYSKKGRTRLCTRICDGLYIRLFDSRAQKENSVSIDIPVGSYSNYSIDDKTSFLSCGLATRFQKLGKDNDPDNFFLPERFEAKLLWFTSGFVEYRVSKADIPEQLKELEVSFEACAEAPFFRNNYKSDITLWINELEVGTWTCPGDFGGRRGALNPDWWPDSMTQYGMLTSWRITNEGCWFNNEPIGERALADFALKEHPFLSIRIGVKDDAANKGGLNLFGNAFGDYNQDIVFRMRW